MYALNLGEGGRILSVCTVLSIGSYGGMPQVGSLPDGDISDYKYLDGEYVYDPLPDPEPPGHEPTAEEDVQEMVVDHEYRLTLLELGITE